MHWPAPVLSADVSHDRGPVMITVEYHVDAASRDAFLAAMDKVGEQRRRDGAYAWGIFEHTGEPAHYIEYFLVASWVEHLRQHDRVTMSDQDQQASVRRYHQANSPRSSGTTWRRTGRARDESRRHSIAIAGPPLKRWSRWAWRPPRPWEGAQA